MNKYNNYNNDDDIIELSSDGAFESKTINNNDRVQKFDLENLDYSLVNNNDSPTKPSSTSPTTNVLSNIACGEYKIYQNSKNNKIIDVIIRFDENDEVPKKVSINNNENNIMCLEIKSSKKVYKVDIPSIKITIESKSCQSFKDYCITRIITK